METTVRPQNSYELVSRQVSDTVLNWPIKKAWLLGLFIAFSLFMLLLFAVTVLLVKGIGIWGVQIPVAWGFAITNFVWWIGIGHAGTFISAILFLLKQDWRTSINRFAEAMTIFAVSCAGLFPLLHLGRPWFFYWLLPYPNTMTLWPQWRSPLIWDVFAVLTYFTVSAVFWYMGLLPDLAILRDQAKPGRKQKIYALLALGWRGSALHWKRYQTTYLILAGLATPLVISVHSIVSLDFTVSVVPGWHSTIFPPYFVAGAIFSGFAMVLTLAIPLRRFYKFEKYITDKHLDLCAKLMLTSGLIVTYSYIIEVFTALYSNNRYERFIEITRAFGPYAFFYWVLIFCNVVLIQLLWFKRVRVSAKWLFVISLLINVGMWTERYVIVVSSLAQDYMPSIWRVYSPTFYDLATLFGSLGLFFLLFFLFVRWLPTVATSELLELIYKKGEGTH